MRTAPTVLLIAATLSACSRGAEPAGAAAAPGASVQGAPGAAPPADASASASQQGSAPLVVPAVDLDGVEHPVSATLIKPGAARVYASSFRTYVYERPAPSSAKLGYLRLGSSAPVRGAEAGREGCPGGWQPIEPIGFVCLGKEATLDGSSPLVAAMEKRLPELSRRLPYIYGIVRRPGPVYGKLPSPEELRAAEGDLEARMSEWLQAPGEVGASYAQHVWLGGPGTPPDPAEAWRARRTEGVPRFLQGGQPSPSLTGRPRELDGAVLGRMKPKLGYSLLETFLYEGRRYGLTTELGIVPTDRLRPIQGSEFHGFRIGKDIEFPFAIVRREGARYWQLKGRALEEGPTAPYRGAVQLTGRQQFFRGRLHYEVAAGGWLSDRDASRLDPIRRMPKWGTQGERWIDINITKQTLMLVEGTEPVYATLISTGEAGLEDPSRSTATKRGIFRIHTKHLTATMDSDEVGEEFELRDVPYVQYFDKEGYALHGAYWHDRFGVPKSHGCINLAPEDARRVFHWTSPAVPVGWHGAMVHLKGTILFVHP